MDLLKKLTQISSPSGEEFRMRDFVLDYVKSNQSTWKRKPHILHGEEWLDSIVLVFGKPKLAIYAHMDTVGFHVRYDKELITIGSPSVESNVKLVGSDYLGKIECGVDTKHPDYHMAYSFFRDIERGTSLTYKPYFKERNEHVEASYLDNRIGLWIALKLAEIATDLAIVFSCGEEQKGGSVGFLSGFLYHKYGIKQALVADVSALSKGIRHGGGAIISRRDAFIPRKVFFDKIISIAKQQDAHFQIEVEYAGSTDGHEIQMSPYPIDWCYIGAAVDNLHSPIEKIHKIDIFAMFYVYSVLIKNL
jgi:putative aminopeptidase FrvX